MGAAIERLQGVHAGVAIAAVQVAVLEHRLHGGRARLVLAARFERRMAGALCGDARWTERTVAWRKIRRNKRLHAWLRIDAPGRESIETSGRRFFRC